MKTNRQTFWILFLLLFLLIGCNESSSSGNDSGTTPPDDGDDPIINIAATASRTDGVAPLSVFFNADLTTSTATVRTFHNYHYEWDFGDGSAGTWASGESQDVDSGPCASHVYETAGTYTATLTVKEQGINGYVIRSTQTFDISVSDPDGFFSGTYTACFSDDANSDFTGCPAGAVQIATDDLTNLYTYADAGERILLHRGSAWTLDSDIAFPENAGPVSIGAYGGCDAPDSFGICSNAPEITTSGVTAFLDLRYKQDWRISDLTIIGPTTDQGAFVGIGNMRNILIQRIDTTGFSTPIGWTHWRYSDNDNIDGMAVVSCRSRNFKGMGFYVGSERLTVMGNEIQSSEDTHVSRVWWAFKGVYSHNYVSGASLVSGTGRHALKLHSVSYWPDPNNTDPSTHAYKGNFATTGKIGLPEFTMFVIVADNVFGGSGPWPVAIGPTDSLKDERLTDIIFERNWYSQEYGTQVSPLTQIAIHFASSYGTIRNNIIDVTGSANGTTGIFIERRGIEMKPQGNEVYNNTIYRGNDGATTSNPHSGIAVHTDATDTIIKNNLVSYQYITSTPTLLSDASGNAISFNNYLTDDPADPADLVDPNSADALSRDFSLGAGASDLIGQGGTIPVFDDFDKTERIDPLDIGAYAN